MKQLDLFETNKNPYKEMQDIRNEWNKVRKALFQEISVCKKQYQELAHEHMILKLNICRGKIV